MARSTKVMIRLELKAMVMGIASLLIVVTRSLVSMNAILLFFLNCLLGGRWWDRASARRNDARGVFFQGVQGNPFQNGEVIGVDVRRTHGRPEQVIPAVVARQVDPIGTAPGG